ncbi:triose-phosphate isomerase [Alphaproteobacteria bacterium]|nr:triose-phosphate isomerase [Alphaproteobacteria bacterium]
MKYIIFNWKSYLNLKETSSLSKLIASIPKSKKHKIISAPNNFFHLSIQAKYIKNALAAQNLDLHGLGASTGSLDISFLKDSKIKYCILGHSEVRANFKDTDNTVAQKLNLCISGNITPIVCIGESKSVYKSKNTKKFLKTQIDCIFDKKTSYKEIIVAYEPLWSIGTGLTPKMSEIDDICNYLHDICKKYSFKKIKILYGGSVNLDNVSDILNLQKVNGVLVGSASTKSDFIKYFK